MLSVNSEVDVEVAGTMKGAQKTRRVVRNRIVRPALLGAAQGWTEVMLVVGKVEGGSTVVDVVSISLPENLKSQAGKADKTSDSTSLQVSPRRAA